MWLNFLCVWLYQLETYRRNMYDYWSVNAETWIKKMISRDNFVNIFRALYHVKDETLDEMENRLNNKYCLSWIAHQKVSIDEMMRLFKGRSIHKCFEPSKPTKWGK